MAAQGGHENGRDVDAVEDFRKLGTAPGFCHHCQTGRCPVGVTTQDPMLERRLTPAEGAAPVASIRESRLPR